MEQSTSPLDLIERYKIQRFYHFTAAANQGQIYQYGGLYARSRHAELGIVCREFVSDDLSRSRDSQMGLDGFIHLSFVRENPMMYVSQNRNKQIKMWLLHLNPKKVLMLNGVVFTDGMANSSFARRYPISEMRRFLPLTRPLSGEDFLQNSSTLEQFVDRKAQLLVPDFIPLNHILRFEEL